MIKNNAHEEPHKYYLAINNLISFMEQSSDKEEILLYLESVVEILNKFSNSTIILSEFLEELKSINELMKENPPEREYLVPGILELIKIINNCERVKLI